MARRTISRERSRDDYDPTPDESRDIGRYDEDSEPPRRGRGRSRSRDDDEPVEQRSRSRRSSRTDDEDERPRGRRSRDDEDDRPKRERPSLRNVGKGWGGFDKVKTASGEFVNHWPVPERPTLFKFLEDEPFFNYSEHFIDDLPKGTKKSYVCLGEDCPLCDFLGDRPSVYSLFNILVLDDPDNPKNEFLRSSQGLTRTLETYAKDKRTSPLNRWDLYWTIFREKKKGAKYELSPVKARDVEEDYEFEPFSEDELEEFLDGLITEEEAVYINSKKDLRDVVDLLDD